MHEQRGRAQRHEGVGERGLVGGVVALGGLGGVVPALVGGAGVLLGDAERTMGVELVGATLEGEDGVARGLDGLGGGGDGGQVRVADVGGAVEAAARQAVEDVGQEGALLEGGVDHARVVADEHVLACGLVLVGDRGVKGLGVEGDGLLVEAQGEPVRAQLLGRVGVQKLRGHRRGDLAGARGLLVHEQDVVVGHGTSCVRPQSSASQRAGCATQ